MEVQGKAAALVALLLVAIASNGVVFQVSNAQSICNVSEEGLMACRPSVTPPNPPPPSGICCAAISHADIRCFCSYRNSPALPAFGVDPSLAMMLPAKCKLPHPAHC
ncbi:hypothetical protein RJ639_004895 [Escallonia herrerae]|uniref:Bifunctional inhibitor/plant lipid transfer protein/seed storage helical domain-containing protein n=1 Tax=Escallonia herrerae TaxID=1293975 RepID=A0AA89AXA4_9ASTE|nr:hypothetical protein RJ639_004895 [Escallonia herrerae]